mgnify:CR=1 FL=1
MRTITSRQNPLVALFRDAAATSDARPLVLLDGPHLVATALDAGLTLPAAAVLEAEGLRQAAILKAEGVPLLIHQPSYSMLNRWVEDALLGDDVVQGMLVQGRDRHAGKLLPHGGDDVQVCQGRLDHHDIRSFLDIQIDLAQRFPSVRRIHLVGLTIAELGTGERRIPKRRIETRREFRRVGHDRQLGEPGLIKLRADGSDPPIHHIGGSHHIRTGLGMSTGHCAQALSIPDTRAMANRCKS